MPVLLLGAGCRDDVGAGSPGGSPGGDGSSDGSVSQESVGQESVSQESVSQEFDDVESTLSSIESEMAEEGR
ncbi:MAG TPA: hypothetical protein VGP26_05440 [Actinophytocola sp.]|nr:hypothetical protein [Actinophytocola sp.]